MKRKLIRIEGYWWNEAYPGYPFPEARNKVYEGWANLLDGLIVLQNSDLVNIDNFKGWSNCRLCDEKVGSKEYSCNEDKKYTRRWPERLYHYISEHNVRPSKDFREFIKKMRYKVRYEK